MHCIIKDFLLDYDSFTFHSLPHVTIRLSRIASLEYYSRRKSGNELLCPLHSIALYLPRPQFPGSCHKLTSCRVGTEGGNDREQHTGFERSSEKWLTSLSRRAGVPHLQLIADMQEWRPTFSRGKEKSKSQECWEYIFS